MKMALPRRSAYPTDRHVGVRWGSCSRARLPMVVVRAWSSQCFADVDPLVCARGRSVVINLCPARQNQGVGLSHMDPNRAAQRSCLTRLLGGAMRLFKAPRGAGTTVSTVLTLGVTMALLGTSAASALVVEETFEYTGSEQTLTVPAGVTTIHVVATGAAGGTASDGGTPGGQGAVVSGDLSVNAGLLYIEVGGLGSGAGGFNGGGNGGKGGFGGEILSGGGGGASDVREVPSSSASSLQSRLLVAGGGGGGGIFQEQSNPACPGGPGGDEEQPGKDGANCGNAVAFGGGAGEAGVAGAGGAGQPKGTPGTLGAGGDDTSEGNGGGGGGGLYGGGGGGGTQMFTAGAAGGGGGSNLVPAGGTSAVSALGAQPSITITYNAPVAAGTGTTTLVQGTGTTSPPPLNVSAAKPIVGANVAISGSGDVVAVHGKTALLPITCRSAAACSGVVDLQSRPYGSGGQVLYAHTHYAIPPGKTVVLALALRTAARKLLSHHKHAPAYLYLHPSGGLPAGTRYVGGKIQLTLRDSPRR